MTGQNMLQKLNAAKGKPPVSAAGGSINPLALIGGFLGGIPGSILGVSQLEGSTPQNLPPSARLLEGRARHAGATGMYGRYGQVDPSLRFIPATQPAPEKPRVVDRSPVVEPAAARRAFDSEKSRIAQLTAQDPELKRYEIAATKTRKPGATEQDIQSAEDIGMAMWAKANPKLAAKVKPGQSGYEVIQNELNAGQMGPVTNFPFDTTRPLSPTPIPPEQRAVTYEGVKPVTLEGVTPIVGGGFPTEQAAMFERFQQSIAPNKPSFQGSPLGTATPLVGNLSYTGSITPIGTTAVQGGDFRSEQARKLAEMFKNAQFSS